MCANLMPIAMRLAIPAARAKHDYRHHSRGRGYGQKRGGLFRGPLCV